MTSSELLTSVLDDVLTDKQKAEVIRIVRHLAFNSTDTEVVLAATGLISDWLSLESD